MLDRFYTIFHIGHRKWFVDDGEYDADQAYAKKFKTPHQAEVECDALNKKHKPQHLVTVARCWAF
jgi:hypothetical protein